MRGGDACSESSIRDDIVDEHFAEALPVPECAPVLFLALVFQYPDFGRARISQDRPPDFCVLNQRRPYREFLFSHRKDMIELDR